MNRRVVAEALLVVVIFSAAAWWATRYADASRAAGREPVFYQDYYEPAVLFACGKGFALISPLNPSQRPPGLDQFLRRQTDRFDCASLPAALDVTKTGLYQYAWYYLMMTVALAWKVLGVSWSGLSPLYGVLFGVTVVCVYGIGRLLLPPPIAVLCASAVGVSTLHLLNLPHLRDYAKAPFVLTLIFLLVWIVRRPRSPRVLMAAAGAYGLVLGVGYGFRTDLLANIPPFFVALFLFLPGGLFRNLRTKAAALVVCLATFVAVAWPVVTYVVDRGGCQWHVVLLGLDTRFNDQLGVEGSFYQWGYAYSDEYIYTTIGSYVNRTSPPHHVEFCASEYDAASFSYLKRLVAAFPGDFATRGLASATHILNLPFPWFDAPLPGFADRLYRIRSGLLKPSTGASIAAALLSALLLGAADYRLGLFALFCLAYFGGYPALQFHNRHYFHLEFIGWLALTFPAWQLVRLVRARVTKRGEDGAMPVTSAQWMAFGRRAAIFACLACACIYLTLQALRWYQRGVVRSMTEQLIAAPTAPVAITLSADGKLLMVDEGTLPPVEADAMRTAYLEVTFDLVSCPAGASLSAYYDPANPAQAFSGAIAALPAGTVAERVLVPVYRSFKGFALGAGGAACIRDVKRLASVQGIPFLPVLTLPTDWRSLPHHQRLLPVWP